MENPKVSVIVPIYNVEKYLDRCMQSLLNQTLKDIEIIMVDDGSPDNCPKMCDEYAKKDNRVKVVHKQNAGLGYARNSGLDIATGEYVAFVDSDDYVELDAYEQMFTSALKNGADAVFASFKTETSPGNWVIEKDADELCVLSQKESYEYALGMIANAPFYKDERSHSMSVWHALYKKSIIDNHCLKFLSERDIVCEDIPFQIDFLSKSQCVILLPVISYYYCLNGTSLTATVTPEKFERYIKLRELLIRKIGNSNNEILRIERFFIGYARAQVTQLIASNCEKKIQSLKELSYNRVWEEVKLHYKAKYLPFPRAVIYWLTINHYIYVLYIYCTLFVVCKKLLCKRI